MNQIFLRHSLVCLWRCASTGGLGTGEVQVHPLLWMDGAPVGAESLWPSVIWWKPVFKHPVDGWCAGGCWVTLAQCDPWKPVFSSNPKNPVLGFHGWDETVPHGSVYLVSSFFFFFSLSLFLIMLFFFLALTSFLGLFFSCFLFFLEITHLCIMHRVHTSLS